MQSSDKVSLRASELRGSRDLSVSEAYTHRSGPVVSPLKRTLSLPGHDLSGHEKILKLARTDIDKRFHDSERAQCDIDDSAVSSHSSKSQLTKAPSAHPHTSFPIVNSTTNVPLTSWPYDPRLAFFLRNDFVQTYSNLMEMYSIEASKIKQIDS